MTDGTRVRLSALQKLTNKVLEASLAVPQFTIEMRCRPVVAPLVDQLIASVAAALRRHPNLNSSYDTDGFILHERINISYALDVDGSLMAPVICDADRLDVDEIGRERARLKEAVRLRTLTADEAYSGTFTISNLGPLGVERFRSIVLPPQVASLAVGSSGSSGAAGSRELCLSLSCDHRVVNGAPAARFLADVVRSLEGA